MKFVHWKEEIEDREGSSSFEETVLQQAEATQRHH